MAEKNNRISLFAVFAMATMALPGAAATYGLGKLLTYATYDTVHLENMRQGDFTTEQVAYRGGVADTVAVVAGLAGGGFMGSMGFTWFVTDRRRALSPN
ncbi:MAG TPA: hypothetical protein VIN59_08430 [Alphaproteobacteria bacterium]